MPGRRKSRQRALQILFLWDLRKLSAEEALDTYYKSLYAAESEEEKGDDVDIDVAREPFVDSLVRGTTEHSESLDRLIAERAENWRLERMPHVDRNILRMAIFEMQYQRTPPPIVIDEALELARRYSEEDAIPFLNGVLDSVRRLVAPEAIQK